MIFKNFLGDFFLTLKKTSTGRREEEDTLRIMLTKKATSTLTLLLLLTSDSLFVCLYIYRILNIKEVKTIILVVE